MFENKKIFYCLLGVILSVSLLVYIRNAWVYAQGAAYDGGAHIDYIMTIVEQKRLPGPAENYLAWHEPLYYVVNAGVIAVLHGLLKTPLAIQKFLQIENALVAWSMTVAAVILAWRLTKKHFTTLLVALLTPMIFVISALGRYATNETWFQALVVWFVAWFVYKNMTNPDCWNVRRWILVGIFLGLLTVVKLTAFVVVGAVCLWLVLLAFKKRNWKLLYPVFFVTMLVSVCYAPWLVYKQRTFGTALTINNFENKNGVVEKRKLPAGFFYTFDRYIFKTPAWPTGKKSFATIVFASTFGDYDNVFERYATKPADAVQTVNGRFMSRFTWRATRMVFVLGLPLVVLLLLGTFFSVYKKSVTSPEFFMLIVVVGFLSALVYNVISYPFLDRGTLKAIFIAAVFPLLGVLGLSGLEESEWLLKRKKVFWLVNFYVVLWAVVSLAGVVWVD